MPVHREVVNGLLLDSIAYNFTPPSSVTEQLPVGSPGHRWHQGLHASEVLTVSFSHKTQAATDSTASPLYRAAGGSMEGWKIVHTRTVEWDDERCALALRKEEERIRTLLNHVFNLHNVNRCVDPNEQRRLYMKRWREAHGQGTPDSYTARKAREARERRRALQNESGASGSEPLATALGASE
jgi:hypothetical protein